MIVEKREATNFSKRKSGMFDHLQIKFAKLERGREGTSTRGMGREALREERGAPRQLARNPRLSLGR